MFEEDHGLLHVSQALYISNANQFKKYFAARKAAEYPCDDASAIVNSFVSSKVA